METIILLVIAWIFIRVYSILVKRKKGKKEDEKQAPQRPVDEFGRPVNPRMNKEQQIEWSIDQVKRREEAKERSWDAERTRKQEAALREKEEAQRKAKLQRQKADLENRHFEGQPRQISSRPYDSVVNEEYSEGDVPGALQRQASSPKPNSQKLDGRKPTVKPSVTLKTDDSRSISDSMGHLEDTSQLQKDVVNGFIMAELLLPPKALRHQKRL